MLVSMFGSQVLLVSFTGRSWCSCNAVPCENSIALRTVGLVVLCGPRELDSVARYRTDFVSLGSAVCAVQCPQEFHLWLGT